MRGQGPATKHPSQACPDQRRTGAVLLAAPRVGPSAYAPGLADGQQAGCSAIACAQSLPAMYPAPARHGAATTDPQAASQAMPLAGLDERGDGLPRGLVDGTGATHAVG